MSIVITNWPVAFWREPNRVVAPSTELRLSILLQPFWAQTYAHFRNMQVRESNELAHLQRPGCPTCPAAQAVVTNRHQTIAGVWHSDTVGLYLGFRPCRLTSFAGDDSEKPALRLAKLPFHL